MKDNVSRPLPSATNIKSTRHQSIPCAFKNWFAIKIDIMYAPSIHHARGTHLHDALQLLVRCPQQQRVAQGGLVGAGDQRLGQHLQPDLQQRNNLHGRIKDLRALASND